MKHAGRGMMKTLRQYFEYKSDGSFIRLVRSANAHAGVRTRGTLHHSGYRCIRFLGRVYRFHQLVWAWHYGEVPERIDHINRDRGDNRIENLRLASRAENAMNQIKHSRNTTGVKGLYWSQRDRLWYGSVQAFGVRKKVCSADRSTAVQKLFRLRKVMHGQFARS